MTEHGFQHNKKKNAGTLKRKFQTKSNEIRTLDMVAPFRSSPRTKACFLPVGGNMAPRLGRACEKTPLFSQLSDIRPEPVLVN